MNDTLLWSTGVVIMRVETRRTQTKMLPLWPLCPPQTLHGLARVETLASAKATAQPMCRIFWVIFIIVLSDFADLSK